MRGCHNDTKLDQCKILIAEHKLSFLGLLETKLNQSLTQRASKYINPAWKNLHNLVEAPYGRILLLYNPSVIQLSVIHATTQMMHCSALLMEEQLTFNITVVYAANNTNVRKTMLDEIPNLRQNAVPWIILGDFNCCYDFSHRKGGNPLSLAEIRPLKEAIATSDLVPIKRTGLPFSWNNKSKFRPRTYSLIDHTFCNSVTFNLWPTISANQPPPLHSDHSPIILHLSGVNVKGSSSFKFFNNWFGEPDFQHAVLESWGRTSYGSTFCRENLRTLKMFCVHGQNKGTGLGANRQLSGGREEIQTEMMNDTNNAVHVTMETYINKQYLAAPAEEDAMTKQKARIKWRIEGDSNSAFFHASLKDKQCRENLVSIVDNSGNIVNNKSEVEHAFIEHFSELLGNKEGFIPNIDNIDPYTLPKLTSADSQSLCNEVTNEEIERAMFSLNSSSSGGPDGFNAFFYQKCWNTLQPAVCNAVRHYFKTGNMPQSYNCTNIALIPKIKNATRVADYRPISCCNTIYKCISKIIASRLKVVLPSIISKNQAAFLEGRSILDNVLLSHELLHGYGNKNTSPRAMFKLDIMKAFDMLQWDSIIRVLSYMNFPATFITWIYSCISTPMFSILLNGSPVGFFKSKQGIRQGDPLSAYLFIIIMELLTQMLNAKMEQGLFKLHPQCAEPRISSLMFADDLVIFCTPDVGTVQTIFDTLDIFYTMTGLKVNQQKSDMMTAGLSSSQVNDLCSKTGLRCSNDTLTYLGLPLCTARITTTQCMPMFAVPLFSLFKFHFIHSICCSC